MMHSMWCKEVEAQRDVLFDMVKGFGILCVFVGHSVCGASFACRLVHFFHMPLFFLVAGMVFKPERIATFADLLKKVFISLGIPYLCFSIATTVFQMDQIVPMWMSSPSRMAYKVFVHGSAPYALWFLTCLAFVRIIMWWFARSSLWDRRGMKMVAIAGCAIFAEIVSRYRGLSCVYNAPVMMRSLPSALTFSLLGFCACAKIRWTVNRLNSALSSFSLALGSFVLLMIFCRYTDIESFSIFIGRFSIFAMLPCLCGVAGVFMFCRTIQLLQYGQGGGLMFIGQFSLCFFVMEQNYSHFLTIFARKIGFSFPELYQDGYVSWRLSALRFGVVLVCGMLLARPINDVISFLKRKTLCFLDGLSFAP